MLRLGARCVSRPLGRSVHTNPGLPRHSNRLVKVGLGTCALSLVSLAGAAVYADALESSESTRAPLSTLLRSYFVYSVCSVPAFVNYSPTLLEACASIPGLKQTSEAIVRRTFFAQFVGGDTCEDALPLIAELRRQNKGTLLAYSVEVDEKNSEGGAAQSKKNVDEMRASVDFAGDFEDVHGQKGPRKTWVAIKLSALVPAADSLKRMSTFLLKGRPRDDVPYPGTPASFDLAVFEGPKETLLKGGLTEEDIMSLRTLYDDLRRVCRRARERGIRLIFDAEHTWYQPGIDAFVMALSREFNQPPRVQRSSLPDEQPLVYGTYQAYLKRTPAHLASSLRDAQRHQYSLGVKLVRGAYRDKEIAHYANKSTESDCPVWPDKVATDACYNSCAKTLVERLAESYGFSSAGWTTRSVTDKSSPDTRIGLLFGTHNNLSCAHILECLVEFGLAYRGSDGKVMVKDGVEQRICFGQLYGMRDDLTNWVANSVRAKSPMVLKYVPYGALADVMPYLSRRAIENQSVLGGEGGAKAERKMAGQEIKKRLFG
ncbi:hypothetical protein FRC12_000621 [Ceratobasidium sp. 428]|nr:hypothetical protein FRC12_000621 [Ceratobasidium sp. 428]